jgi:hydroxypyruvate isomerase
MPRFAANLSFLYAEWSFLDRFGAAAADGFEAVEYLFPYEHPPEAIAQRLKTHGLTQALFNLPPGDWAAGERGMACHPGREAEFAASVQTALRYAQATGCQRLHAMAGLAPAGVDADTRQRTYVTNLKVAARVLAPHGITLLIEPINTRDMPGYHLNLQQQAHDTVAEVAEPNLKVQMDLYHCQIVEGDVAMKLRQYLPTGRVGHLQIAGVPQRHEPDLGELHHPYLFQVIDELMAAGQWDGWIGCEYRPARGAVPGGTSDGLGWLKNR